MLEYNKYVTYLLAETKMFLLLNSWEYEIATVKLLSANWNLIHSFTFNNNNYMQIRSKNKSKSPLLYLQLDN